MPHYNGGKLMGRHTTYLDTRFAKRVVRKANKHPKVSKINLGIISKTTGKPRALYSAKVIRDGLCITILQARSKQEIFLKTSEPRKVADDLGIKTKDG